MNFGALTRRAQKVVADNTPTILTAIAVTGTITTAVLAGKAGWKSSDILSDYVQQLKDENPGERVFIEHKKIVELTWKQYVPAVGTGLATIACIVGANRVSLQRQAALATAYSVSQELAGDYKKKVLEKFGEKKEREVSNEVAADREKRGLPAEIIHIGAGEVLCKDTYSGRYFNSTREEIRRAVNDTNFQIMHDDYATLSDFWDRIGLPHTAESDLVGWNTNALLEIVLDGAVTTDGRPCLTIDFTPVPFREHSSLH